MNARRYSWVEAMLILRMPWRVNRRQDPQLLAELLAVQTHHSCVSYMLRHGMTPLTEGG